MWSELNGLTGIITGGAGHIGSAAAAVFAGYGAKIAVVDILDPRPVAERIAAAGGQALPVQADMNDPGAVAGMVDDVLAFSGGTVDFLVNFAGLFNDVPRVPFWEIDPGTWDAVVESNLRTAFLCTQAVSAPMRRAGSGRIVHVSSNTSAFGMGDFLHYTSSKAGLVGMARSMARELGPYGIAVNAVGPGLVHTPAVVAAQEQKYLDQVVGGQCLRQPIVERDIVDAVGFLVSPSSRMITGQTLLVNGGATMGAF